jgi:uncharacterized protein YecT (DUF1311 family)
VRSLTIAALLIAAQGLATAPLLAQTQSAMNTAATGQAKAADAALNAQYKATAARLSPANRLLLRDAQRSWISFRDQQCRFETAGVKGGSAFPLVQAGCLRKLSEDRTRQLRSLAQCPEGDLSCPR